MLDGLAQLEPYGVDDWALKMQGRNLEGWMNVYNLDEDAGMPWFKLSASFKDAAEVNEIIEGNFALALLEIGRQICSRSPGTLSTCFSPQDLPG